MQYQHTPEWVKILKCPVSGQELVSLSDPDVRQLQADVIEGKIWQLDGSKFNLQINSALSTRDGRYLFPILDGVVILLSHLGLTRSENNILPQDSNPDKQLVQDFYNEKGWFTDEEGNYEDAVIYEDLRDVSADYLSRCHDRVSRYLKPSGTYMLDAASGAIQYDDYLQYSRDYKYRVCVDFSIQALKEAKKKLGDKGLYILADICNLPFQDNVMDGFISLNTIYHIPKDQQVTAIRELYRTLTAGGKGVVVYDWFKHSAWMNLSLLPFRGFVYLKNRMLETTGKISSRAGLKKRLYFHAYNLNFMEKNLPPFRLGVWRSVSVPFMRYYIHPWFFGREILNYIYSMEEKNPEKCGRLGEYPMFIFEK